MECSSCHRFIDTGEPVIRGRVHKSGKTYSFIWHVKNENGDCCWVEDGLLELEKNPKVETRGRKRLAMPDTDRARRIQIQKRRANIIQKLKKATSIPAEERNYDLVVELGTELEQLKLEISSLGGVPVGW